MFGSEELVLFFHDTDNFQNIRLLEVGFKDFSDRIVFVLLDIVVNLLKCFEIVFETPILFNIAEIRKVFFFVSVSASNVVFHFSCVLVPKSRNCFYGYEGNYYSKAQNFIFQRILSGSV